MLLSLVGVLVAGSLPPATSDLQIGLQYVNAYYSADTTAARADLRREFGGLRAVLNGHWDGGGLMVAESTLALTAGPYNSNEGVGIQGTVFAFDVRVAGAFVAFRDASFFVALGAGASVQNREAVMLEAPILDAAVIARVQAQVGVIRFNVEYDFGVHRPLAGQGLDQVLRLQLAPDGIPISIWGGLERARALPNFAENVGWAGSTVFWFGVSYRLWGR